MKTHAILLNTSNFPYDIKKDKTILIDYAYYYVDIFVEVFRTLNVFSYKKQSKNYSPIIGKYEPEKLKAVILEFQNNLYFEISNAIKDVKLIIDKNIKIELLSEKTITALKLISGVYLFESSFLNCETKSTIIRSSELQLIFNNINNYMIIFYDFYL